MKRVLVSVDRTLKLMYLLFFFWGIFFLIEGLQKFEHADVLVTSFFQWLPIPEGAGVAIVYLVGAVELALGLIFGLLLYLSSSEQRREVRGWPLFVDRTMHRVAFKTAILLLTLSIPAAHAMAVASVSDNALYLLLILVTYDLWYRTDQYVQSELSSGLGS